MQLNKGYKNTYKSKVLFSVREERPRQVMNSAILQHLRFHYDKNRSKVGCNFEDFNENDCHVYLLIDFPAEV